MRNLLFSIALLALSTGVSQAQSAGPYPAQSPGLFSDQMNQMQTLSNSTDIYLQQRQQPQFARPAPTQAVPAVDWNEFWAERNRAQTRAIEADTARLQRQIDRDMAEIHHMELLNAIERRR